MLYSIDCCVVLHNLLIDLKSVDQTNEWLDDNDASDVNDIADALGMTDYGHEISTEDDCDEHNRQRLLFF